ncbi:hypothetical protein [Embleya sp. NPDC001921]
MVDALRELGVVHVSFMPYAATGPNDPCRPVAASSVADVINHCRERTSGTVDFRVPCEPRHCLTDTPTAITAPVDEAFDDHSPPEWDFPVDGPQGHSRFGRRCRIDRVRLHEHGRRGSRAFDGR